MNSPKVDNLIWVLCIETSHPMRVADCPDAECHICGVIECPVGDPMHFHRDGCGSEAFENEVEV